jgi:Holliday junction DNA helicase RuvB
MPKERIVTAQAQEKERETDVDAQTLEIRPRTLREYVGQRQLVERLAIALEAAKLRSDPMEHVLLHGPPGLGKTTIAHVIAAEMGTRAHVTSGPALTKAADLVGTLTKLEHGDVLFIDEIHRLPAAVEEFIYPAMEDRRIDFTLDSGMHARVVTLDLKPFTLIGATTRAGLLTQALRSRFGIAHHLEFYAQDDLERTATKSRRGNPRNAGHRARCVRRARTSEPRHAAHRAAALAAPARLRRRALARQGRPRRRRRRARARGRR